MKPINKLIEELFDESNKRLPRKTRLRVQKDGQADFSEVLEVEGDLFDYSKKSDTLIDLKPDIPILPIEKPKLLTRHKRK